MKSRTRKPSYHVYTDDKQDSFNWTGENTEEKLACKSVESITGVSIDRTQRTSVILFPCCQVKISQ